jgi:hypothetical protein
MYSGTVEYVVKQLHEILSGGVEPVTNLAEHATASRDNWLNSEIICSDEL